MSNKSASGPIQLPQGGGAVTGMGEKFSPDLFTGTGNFSVPIAVPPGRNGIQPALTLGYSTGNGNSPFGLGWNLGVPGVSRKTSKGIPVYDDEKDVFILSGAEDLVPVAGGENISWGGTLAPQRYRPRTEGLFARIEHYRDPSNNFWKVWSKDGLLSHYGTPASVGSDLATICDPEYNSKVCSWLLSRTEDTFGNHILYDYEQETGDGTGLGLEGHIYSQAYLKKIRYIDYDDSGTTRYLVSVVFEYDDRPDPFSTYMQGFEIRTTKRCKSIKVYTHPDSNPAHDIHSKTYSFEYLDEAVASGRLDASLLPLNGTSILCRVQVTGHDPDASPTDEQLPPLDFEYSRFDPSKQKFDPVSGELPPYSVAHPDYEMADLFAKGLPDIVQLNGVARYWRNLGNGKFDIPRLLKDVPAGLKLADPDVAFMDGNGDGSPDLMVTKEGLSGYFPMRFSGEWDRRSFHKFKVAPSFSLSDPEVKLMDMDGDGITDVVRNGSRLEIFFNDRDAGFDEVRTVNKKQLDAFPNISFSDPRIRTADLGGGLQSFILIHNGSVSYWPNMGYGKFGKRLTMKNCPRFPFNFDPKRILIGDLDGDGYDDLVYVENNKVTLWINQSGNAWSDPIEIAGTPPVTDMDAVRITDLNGEGVAGILWSRDATVSRSQQMLYLNLTGGVKPYLLHAMINNMGAETRVDYASSAKFYIADYNRPETRWDTPLPFPVLCVSRVEVIDRLSLGKLTTEYTYHHGYYDGGEREFRGFGRVDQRDTEVFVTYHASNAPSTASPGSLFWGTNFNSVDAEHFSPPTETRTWFHLGPVGDEYGEWTEKDYSVEYWPGDKNLLSRPAAMKDMLKRLPRRARRDAYRTLRGSVLRTELYALDGSIRQNRPYTVSESQTGVGEVLTLLDPNNSNAIVTQISFDGQIRQPDPPDDPLELQSQSDMRIFFAHGISQRSTQWERGEQPMTSLSFTWDYDDYGSAQKSMSLAIPRSRTSMDATETSSWLNPATLGSPDETYLSTYAETYFINKNDEANDLYLIARPCEVRGYEVVNDGSMPGFELVAEVMDGTWTDLELIGHTLNYYDGGSGDEYVGETLGTLGDHGILTRAESLILTTEILNNAYGSGTHPPYLYASPSFGGTDYASLTDFTDSVTTPPQAGYIPHTISFLSGTPDGWYSPTVQNKFDFHTTGGPDPVGLLLATRDPFENVAAINSYDDYAFFPTETEDALGNTTTAVYDYRVMQALLVTDPNRNRQAFHFSPLGLLTESGVMGKENDADGDVTNETGDIPEFEPSAKMEYDLFAYHDNGEPVFVRSIRQIWHYNDADYTNATDNTIEEVEYSDGFGRVLQKRTQAEDVIFGNATFGDSGLPASQASSNQDAVGTERGSGDPLNVVVSGWQRYNNKGWVVEKWEPFFDAGWDYDDVSQNPVGVSVKQYYDPRGQVVRTLNPDDTEMRVIFGIPSALNNPDVFTPTPWESYSYDANDLAFLTWTDIINPNPTDSSHFWTPKSAKLDAMGRTIEVTDRNGSNPGTDFYTMFYSFDIRGNLLEVTDYLSRTAFTHVYDLRPKGEKKDDPGANVLRTEHLDGGIKTAVFNAAFLPVEMRDAKGALILNKYDELLRPLNIWARDISSEDVTLRQNLIYGETDAPNSSAPEDTNHRGKLYQHYDEAGKVEIAAYDYKGNILSSERKVIQDSVILDVFSSGASTSWAIDAFRVDWDTLTDSDLESDSYLTLTEFDALNRPIRIQLPEDQDGSGNEKVLLPTYNRAGALEKIEIDGGDTFINHIAYNARGQRLLIALGNDIMTRYIYDSQTFRLVRQKSEEYTYSLSGSTHTYAYNSGTTRQDNAYKYDLQGNITGLTDARTTAAAGGSGTLTRAFTYDPLYRLLSATGREAGSFSINADPWYDYAPDNTESGTRAYTQSYEYDEMGNMQQLSHVASGNTFNRVFTYVSGKNLLSKLTVGTTDWLYSYDGNGNLIQEYSNRFFEWDHSDKLRVFFDQVTSGSEPSIYAHYLYGADGNRVKKIVRKNGGDAVITVYASQGFEHRYNLSSSTRDHEHNNIHIMDNRSRVAVVRVGTAFSSDSTPDVCYNLEDHLGNSSCSLDDVGSFITWEEYFPFGETSFGGFGKKRYRFCGKERDEESGLYYYGMRYYNPGICRFVSIDPLAGKYPFQSAYVYAGNRPIGSVDKDGMGEDPAPKTHKVQKDETLSGIGKKYGLTIKQLREWNPQIKNRSQEDQINPGDNLLLYDPSLVTNNFVFNENGKFVREEATNSLAQLIIENSTTKKREIHSFHDPQTDVAAIKYNINKFGDRFKDIKFIYNISSTRINEMMTESGVEKMDGDYGRIFFMGWSSKGGKLDFSMYHLVIELAKAFKDVVGGVPWDVDNEILKDKGPIFIIANQTTAYNLLDTGNWLWGNAVNRLGGSYGLSQVGAQKFNSRDSESDLNAIGNGWYFQEGYRDIRDCPIHRK